MCLATGVVPIWFEILHSWTIEWIMEQELKPRQQVNLCMSVHFASFSAASVYLLGFDRGVSQTTVFETVGREPRETCDARL